MSAAALTDATVVLTGATAGIGLATARLLAPRVQRLVVHGPQSEAEVAGLVHDLSEHSDITYLRADYGDLAQVRALAAGIRASVSRLDVLINNAGRAGPARRRTKSLIAVISSRAKTGSATRRSSPEASRPAMKSRRSR